MIQATGTVTYVTPQSLLDAIQGALRLDSATFGAFIALPDAPWIALLVLLLAGISQGLGQSVVMFVNRVTPRRFLLGLLLSAGVLLMSVLIWGFSIWLIGLAVFRVYQPIGDVFLVVALAQAPLLFGFFILLPYMGSLIARILDIWIFLALLAAVHSIFALDLWQALLCTLLGWIVIELLKYMADRSIASFSGRLRQLIAGGSLSASIEGIMQAPPRRPPSGGAT